MKNWLSLVLALPTANATARMRAWRALKASGAAVLRDGVYLLPDSDMCRAALADIERDILSINGTAYLLPIQDPQGERFIPLFERSEDYANLRTEIDACRTQLRAENALASTRQVRKLRKAFAQLANIDFFADQTRQQVDAALQELETAVSRALSADEPSSHDQPIALQRQQDYQGRTWATRKRPWVDRLASAWLIRRFIDHDARILWLDSPHDCPPDALGFDFDGATFSHVGNRVTFETLQASFELNAPALGKIAALVHYLDVGGVQPAEAAGIERLLAGLRESITDDDQLLSAANAVFDGLLSAFA
ncbi:chromate resistance protein ChrB domain-containing protein [Metapseudomonas resinovorans]|uniref:Putative chromate resistance protein n=1 Tax=Metapseudomonas resinovorans NBRC 106553 TaxID=1245471 RepID=S6ADA2_METRE|nr:chromate resistance protein ChrB domain-containing protein [Pseudomonas resinovorans]BAN47087.1 putative chromate resistance protein [Pseudomonas resinovorans NBRC 106553]